MKIEKDERKPFTPLSPNSKFLKPNKNGQVAKDCLYFNFCGKHCWINGDYEKNETDCKVLKGKYCNHFKK